MVFCRRSILGCLAGALTARFRDAIADPVPRTPVAAAPACGAEGYTLQNNWTFGISNELTDISSVQIAFDSCLPWGRTNGELQIYTPFSPATHQIVGDELRLVAVAARGMGEGQIDSGQIVSKATWKPPMGGSAILEFCVKVPSGAGMWPSGWLYAVPTAHRNEIDVFEFVNNCTADHHDTTEGIYVYDHSGAIGRQTTALGSLIDDDGKWRAPFDFAADFHTIAVEWAGNTVVRWVDGVKVATRFWTWADADPRIILNLACGSVTEEWPGLPNAYSFENGANVLACRYIRTWVKGV